MTLYIKHKMPINESKKLKKKNLEGMDDPNVWINTEKNTYK